MKNNYADCDAQPRFATAATASGTDAVVTLPADPDQFFVIDWISWSYAGAPTNGSLRVQIGGVTVWQVDITVGGPGHLEFDRPLYTNTRAQGQPARGEAVEVRLFNGGVANKVNVRYR